MDDLAEFFFRGGALMWVLLGFSVVGVAVIVERGVVYWGYGLRPDRWLEGVLGTLRRGETEVALREAGQSPHPVARVVEAYLTNAGRSPGVRAENVRRVGSLVLERVEKRLRVLAAIAHIAPLVGLLGTVAGMVVAFAQIQALQGTVKPADLAGGIWEALLTTVFGLAIAIPCMAAFHAYESHSDKIARRMELAVAAMDDVFDQAEDGIDQRSPEASSAEGGWTSVA